MTMRQIRTYSVRVDGFDAQLYSARSRGKALAQAFSAYRSVWDCTFKYFLQVASVRVAPNPPGIGRRVLIAGLPATVCVGYGGGHYVHFMRDDSDVVLCSHPADVQELPAEAAA